MEYRSFTPDLEIRSLQRRLLCGIVVPFGVDQRIDTALVERFEAGAFTHQYRAANRVRLLSYHSYNPAHEQLGHAVELRGDGAGLYGEFRVVDSTIGDHYLALVREGIADGMPPQWSVGFTPERQHRDGETTVYSRATLFETALVPEGAYGELAAVGQIRAALPVLKRDELLARLPQPLFPA